MGLCEGGRVIKLRVWSVRGTLLLPPLAEAWPRRNQFLLARVRGLLLSTGVVSPRQKSPKS